MGDSISPRWALVGNIVKSHEFGEEHEVRYGSKHFSGGTKVYVNLEYPGTGCEYVRVIGKPRGRGGLIETSIKFELVENLRLQREIIRLLEHLSPEAAERAKGKTKEYSNEEQQR